MKVEDVKQYLIEVKNLIYPFRWYVAAYLIIPLYVMHAYFFPPAADDPIWGAQAMQGAWNYQNQELYIESAKDGLIESILYFLVGTSNMRNHPRLAKLIFLAPWICSFAYLVLVLLGICDSGG